MKIEFSSQRREMLASVMSRAKQKLQSILIFFKFVYLYLLLCLLFCLNLL